MKAVVFRQKFKGFKDFWKSTGYCILRSSVK